MDRQQLLLINFGILLMQLLELFQCFICLEYMDGRIVQCMNGHIMCLSCAERSPRHECPFCRISIAGVRRIPMPDLQNIRDLLREFVHSNDRVNDVISDQSGASSSTRSLIIIDDNDLAELGPNADQNVSAIPSTDVPGLPSLATAGPSVQRLNAAAVEPCRRVTSDTLAGGNESFIDHGPFMGVEERLMMAGFQPLPSSALEEERSQNYYGEIGAQQLRIAGGVPEPLFEDEPELRFQSPSPPPLLPVFPEIPAPPMSPMHQGHRYHPYGHVMRPRSPEFPPPPQPPREQPQPAHPLFPEIPVPPMHQGHRYHPYGRHVMRPRSPQVPPPPQPPREQPQPTHYHPPTPVPAPEHPQPPYNANFNQHENPPPPAPNPAHIHILHHHYFYNS